jgi:hypothetical protein
MDAAMPRSAISAAQPRKVREVGIGYFSST